MKKVSSIVGLVIGVLIIGLSIFVFNYDANIKASKTILDRMDSWSVSQPEYEEKNRYGGDAYTGIQQATAQTANNTVAVFDAVEVVNNNMRKTFELEAQNQQFYFGMLILSIGFVTVAKYLGELIVASSENNPTETVEEESELPEL